MPYAEALRMLRPVAERIGVPRPSYSSVRRIVIAERRRKEERAEYVGTLFTEMVRGLPPHLWSWSTK
jgi:hypothetical protein